MLNLQYPSLSPDPLYSNAPDLLSGSTIVDDFYRAIAIYPNSIGARVTNEKNFEPFSISTDDRNMASFVVDFGTELEALLEIECSVDCCSNIYVCFGESLYEAEMLGTPGTVPEPVEHWHVPNSGRHAKTFTQRGFRFAKISIHDAKNATFFNIVAHSLFAFHKGKIGDFTCSDERFQRVWQTSVYTARLCSRPNEYWDGIKRDRLGWYGDARITQLTTDNVFFDKMPALLMLNNLSTDTWANYTPTYSFDAIAMLRQSIMIYGSSEPLMTEIFKKIITMLAWCKQTQTLENGLFTRDESVRYDYGVGFIDWSPMPLGGRMEEISWLQMKYLEALKNAAFVAKILGFQSQATEYSNDANKLEKTIVKLFWREDKGFIHSVNKVIDDFKMPWEIDHFTKSYIEGVRNGESSPSRHSNSLAIWSLDSSDTYRKKALEVLNDKEIGEIITGYFAYYEQSARAACGDSLGAIMNMRNYIGQQLEDHDSATVWESYEPQVKDFRKWGLQSFPKSLCHAWSSGTVPITTKYMLGITPEKPGFEEISLLPEINIPWSYEAKVPSPHGLIYVSKDSENAAVQFKVPEKIKVSKQLAEGIEVKFY
ncbi:MAG: hypothetical protein WCQ41_04580 [Bacillota bacterium]